MRTARLVPLALLVTALCLLLICNVPSAQADPVQDAARLEQMAPTAPRAPIVGEEELYLAIHKKRHQLHVVMNGQVLYTFPVATGRGDLTPE